MILNEYQIQNMINNKRLHILESSLNDVKEDFDSILKEEYFIVDENATNKEMLSMFKTDIKEYKTYFKTGISAYRAKDFSEAIKYFKLAGNVLVELDKKLRHLDFESNSAMIGNILGIFLILGPYTISQVFFFHNMDKAKNNIPLFIHYTSQEELDAKMKIINKEKAKYYGNATASIITSLVSIVKNMKLIKSNISKPFYGKPNMARNMIVAYISDVKNICDDYIKLCKEHIKNN